MKPNTSSNVKSLPAKKNLPAKKSPLQKITPVATQNTPKKITFDRTEVEKIVLEIIQKELARLGFLQAWNTSTPEEVDDPMDIDLVRVQNSKDLLAVTGKVNGVESQVLADTCANISFIQGDLGNDLGLKFDASVIHNLTGASGTEKSLGVAKSVLIKLAPGCVIEEDLVGVNYPYREIGLSRTCLRRYNYDVHESRDHIALTCNGKNFFIPIVPDVNRT